MKNRTKGAVFAVILGLFIFYGKYFFDSNIEYFGDMPS